MEYVCGQCGSPSKILPSLLMEGRDVGESSAGAVAKHRCATDTLLAPWAERAQHWDGAVRNRLQLSQTQTSSNRLLCLSLSIHLLPNPSCSGHGGNEAMQVMRLEEHHTMQNPFWCQPLRAGAPLLLLHSPAVKVAVLERSHFSVHPSSKVFSAFVCLPFCTRPPQRAVVHVEIEKQESWSAGAAWENLFKQASTHGKESGPAQNCPSPDLV